MVPNTPIEPLQSSITVEERKNLNFLNLTPSSDAQKSLNSPRIQQNPKNVKNSKFVKNRSYLKFFLTSKLHEKYWETFQQLILDIHQTAQSNLRHLHSVWPEKHLKLSSPEILLQTGKITNNSNLRTEAGEEVPQRDLESDPKGIRPTTQFDQTEDRIEID